MSRVQQNLSNALAVSRVLKGELENWKALARPRRKRIFKNYILFVLSWVCHSSESHNIQDDQAIIHNY